MRPAPRCSSDQPAAAPPLLRDSIACDRASRSRQTRCTRQHPNRDRPVHPDRRGRWKATHKERTTQKKSATGADSLGRLHLCFAGVSAGCRQCYAAAASADLRRVDSSSQHGQLAAQEVILGSEGFHCGERSHHRHEAQSGSGVGVWHWRRAISLLAACSLFALPAPRCARTYVIWLHLPWCWWQQRRRRVGRWTTAAAMQRQRRWNLRWRRCSAQRQRQEQEQEWTVS